MVVPVCLCHQNRTVRAVAMLDSGSSTTYLKDSVANKLRLHGRSEEFSASVLGGQVISGKHHRVRVTMKSEDGTYQTTLEAWTQPIVTAPVDKIDWNTLRHQYEHLRNIDFPPIEGDQVDLLIGLNVPGAHCVLEELTGLPGEPVARRLPLGWVCFGSIGAQVPPSPERVLHANVNSMSEHLDELVSKFWEVETVGMMPKSEKTLGEEEAERLVEAGMALKGGRVSCSLPWTSSDQEPHLSDNRRMAEQRTAQLGTHAAAAS